MKVFLVENINGLSHTFIRNDYIDQINHGENFKIIDICDYTFNGNFKFKKLFNFLIRLIILFFFNPIILFKLLFNRKFLSNINAIYVFSQLYAIHKNISQFRIHFISKAAVVGFLYNLFNNANYCVICHASDLYSMPNSMNMILIKAFKIEAVTWFGKGFVFGRIGNHGIGKTILKRNIISNIITSNPPIKKIDILEILTVSRLATQKDIIFALEILYFLKLNYKINIVYNLIGEGPEFPLIFDTVKKLNLTDQVFFHGALQNSEIAVYYESADLFLLPCAERDVNDADGLPVVFQESLSLGCPIFCKDVFGISELIINNINGYAIPISFSAKDCADLIMRTYKKFNRTLIKSIAEEQF